MMLHGLKSLLIGLRYGEGKPLSALRYGLSLAQQAKARASICILLPELALTHAFASRIGTGLVSAENHRLRECADRALEELRKEAGTKGVPCNAEVLQEPYSMLGLSLTRRARVYDMTIVDAQLDPVDLDRNVLEEVLFAGGHPVLVVPRSAAVFRLRKIVVAWDGSAMAARAVSAGLPFLKAADNVEIVHILGAQGSSKPVTTADLTPYLAAHNVKCTVMDLLATDGDAGETLRSHVACRTADMLIMGAFAHSRLRELVLGGVTETMLNTCPVPLCLSH